MSNFSAIIRKPDTGTVVARIPVGDMLYWEYTKTVNDVSRQQGIFSPYKNPNLVGVFDMLNGEKLDHIMEMWFKPFAVRGADNSQLDWILDEQFLIRYQRLEHLNDGRPRDTHIARSRMHLLKRCIIPPPQEPLSPPYTPNAPLRVPPIEVLSTTAPSSIPFAGAWTLPTSEGFDGSFPAPSPAYAGTSTAHRMAQILEYVKLYINPEVLQNVTIAPVPANAGFADHPIDLRYDNVLAEFQAMSAATWNAWKLGDLGAGQLPVDFDLVPDPSSPNSWIFTVFPGGLGVDRTINGIMGGGAEKVLIKTGNDNIIQPVSVRDRTEEKTRAWVGGKNNGTARDVLIVLDADRASASPWNQIDRFVHSAKIPPFLFTGAIGDGIHDALIRGKADLRNKSPRNAYSVILRFDRTLRKGVNLNVGDLVSANLFGAGIENYQVYKMKHTISRTGGITIRAELAELDGNRFEGDDEFKRLIDRQLELELELQYNGEVQ